MIWRLLSSTVNAWLDDYAPSMGAALAFYTLFSIAPLLLIVISVTGFFFGEAAARAEIFAQISLMVGEDSATTLDLVLKSLDKPAASLVGMLVGLGTLLVGATTVFVELQNAMDRIWQVPPRPDFSGVRDFFRVRLLSLGLVLGIGFLLMVSLAMSTLINLFAGWAGVHLSFAPLAPAIQVVNEAVQAPLAELNALMSTAQGHTSVSPDHNPLHPQVFLHALQTVVGQMQVPEQVRRDWMWHLAEALGNELRTLYLDLIGQLRNAGVKPAGYAMRQASGAWPSSTCTTSSAATAGKRSGLPSLDLGTVTKLSP